MMAFQIGTDEAGYGPNLGPLIICGTSWQVPAIETDLYLALKNVVSTECNKPGKIPVCDSKKLHKSSGSLRNLEAAVLAILCSANRRIPENLNELAESLSCSLELEDQSTSEIFTSNLQLPVAASKSEIEMMGKSFLEECNRLQIRLERTACTAVFPGRFNELVREHGNKAELLSLETFKIVRTLKARGSGNLKIVCDKHGGRSKYVGLINHCLTERFVTVGCEAQRISRYHWSEPEVTVDMSFRAGGESFLPVALSSMIAKYLRELTMLTWNRFWETRVPGIRPTKGYPVDAKRFKKEIAHSQQDLGISDDLIWRTR